MTAATAPETLSDLLSAGANDARALIDPDGPTVTFAALRANVDVVAQALRGLGVAPGAKVGMALPNGLPVVIAFLGTGRARAIAAPLNPAYTRDEFAFYLEDIAPQLLLVPPGGGAAAREAAASLGITIAEAECAADGTLSVRAGSTNAAAVGGALEEPQPDDVALFLHTSGTTSRPKGVPLRHRNLCASARNIEAWYRLEARDVSLCVMPLFHIHGIVFSTLAPLGVGARVVVPPKFSASAFWPLVREHGVTIVSAVPTILRTLLLRADEDGAPPAGESTLRLIRSSSSALPAAEFHKLEARFGVPVVQAYSMTEASHQMCANPVDGERRPGSVGVGAHVDVGIMDDDGNLVAPNVEGEVVVRGPNVMDGYHNNPDANRAAFTNGWFRTGDRGVLSEDGYLTLIGRLKELINRGGEKISPVEIDEVLAKHPGVVEVVTFGLPDEKYGEDVAVAVILRDNTTEAELAEHVRAHLSPFKVPKRWFVTDAIPKTATGKVQRRMVAAAFAEK